MKKMPTLFLRLSIFVIGAVVLAFCAIAIPGIAVAFSNDPDYLGIVYPILACVLAASIPVLIALYQTLRILHYMDSGRAFSELSVIALKRIKLCALAVMAVFTINLIFLYFWAEKEDAPGVIVFGMAFVFASFVVAIFAAVLQMLLKEAIDIKSENDLTV